MKDGMSCQKLIRMVEVYNMCPQKRREENPLVVEQRF
jgi:hypothetical protein